MSFIFVLWLNLSTIASVSAPSSGSLRENAIDTPSQQKMATGNSQLGQVAICRLSAAGNGGPLIARHPSTPQVARLPSINNTVRRKCA